MDTLNKYRHIIIDILTGYADAGPINTSPGAELEEQLLIDTERDHYQILTLGWDESRRVYYPVFHIDIKNGKVWVQEDATDYDIVGEMEKRGIPKSDIVLAFHAPYKRPFTGYATA
jgi:hypothetical protein